MIVGSRDNEWHLTLWFCRNGMYIRGEGFYCKVNIGLGLSVVVFKLSVC